MDPDRNLFVLPSNAPTNLEHHSSSRGVLQTTSGNVQSSTLENVEVIPDASSPTAAKGICADSPSQASITPSWRATISTSRRRARLRRPFRERYTNDSGTELTPEQIRWLNERLATSGGFPTLTRSELQCEPYLKYRARQRKNLGKDGKPVWSDHMEEAFQRAVREYRPPGRRKLEMRPQEKRQGSNEWISDYIKMMTGQDRTRKQVSSHIQVLKKFLVNNAEWMSLVTTKEPANSFEDDGCSNQHARHVAVRNYEMLMQHHHRFLNMQNQPAFEETLGSNPQIAPQCRVASFDFKMWVNPPAPDNQRHEALHVCTALAHEAQRAATPLEHIPNWRSLYPDLAPQGEDRDFDCGLIFMESKLDLMTDSPPTGSRLGIDFFARIANGSAYEVWDYTTVFYEKRRRVHDCSGELRFDVEGSSECVGTTKLEMSLESSWWVKFFFKASERRRVREARGDLDALQQVDEATRRSLKEMSIMQEVWATSYANNLPRKRVAVLLWKFRQVRPGEAATTRWRDLIPPPPRITTNSPAPPMLESQMILDASINSHMHQPIAMYTDPFHQQSFDSFADCPDPSSNAQNFDDYPTSGDAFPGPSRTMDYSVSNIDVKQEDLGSVDFSEGHINLYCESYSQPPPTYGHVDFMPLEEGMQEGYNGDEWAAMCAHPGFADVGFEHGDNPQVPDRSDRGNGEYRDVSFEHANLPNVGEKPEHVSEESTNVGFQHDDIEQVADRLDHGHGDYPDVGFEHAELRDVPDRLEQHSEDFTDVGFQHETVPQVADRQEHDTDPRTDVHSRYVNFTQALQNAGHGNEQFTDGSFERANVPDISEKSPHGDDTFTDIGFEHAHSPEVPENPSHTTDVFTDVGFEHPHLPDVAGKPSHETDDFTDVGFEHAHSLEAPENPSHTTDVFTDVGFEHPNLPDVAAKPSHETDDFTDVGFEHANLPDLPQASQHDNDSDYEHVQVQDYAMSFD